MDLYGYEWDKRSDGTGTHVKANVMVSETTHLRFDPITLQFCISFDLASLSLDDCSEDAHGDSATRMVYCLTTAEREKLRYLCFWSILFTCYCVAMNTKLSSWKLKKKMFTISHNFCGSGSRAGSGSLIRLHSWRCLGLRASEYLGVEDPSLSWFILKASGLALALGRSSPLLFIHTDLSEGQLKYPRNAEAGFLRSGYSTREQGRSHNDVCNLAMQVAYHNVCCRYRSRRSNRVLWGRGLPKGVDTRNGDSLKAILKAGYHIWGLLHQEQQPWSLSSPRILHSVSLREHWSWSGPVSSRLLCLCQLSACSGCAFCLLPVIQ